MPSSPSAAFDRTEAARPYGFVGLILSLFAIAALAVVFAAVLAALGFAALALGHGVRGALDLVTANLGAAVGGTHATTAADVLLGLGAYLAQSGAVLAVARFRGGRHWAALVAWRDWQPRRHWRLFAILFALTVAWEVAASLGIEQLHPEAKDWVVPPTQTPSIVGFLALAVLFGPIGEELLFRGWMYTSLRASFGLRVAVLVTAVLFALAHWEQTHLYALAVFPVGLALAVVRERTGSIAASITFHVLYNAVASVLLFLGK